MDQKFQKLLMCSSLLLNATHASLGCFSPSPWSLHGINRLEWEEGSLCCWIAPLSGLGCHLHGLVAWLWCSHHCVEVLKGQIRSAVLHLETYLISCTRSPKLNVLHPGYFCKKSCILHDCTKNIFPTRSQSHEFQQEVAGKHTGCMFNFSCLIATG